MNTIEYTFIPEAGRPMNDLEKEYIHNQCIFVDFPVIDVLKSIVRRLLLTMLKNRIG